MLKYTTIFLMLKCFFLPENTYFGVDFERILFQEHILLVFWLSVTT